MARPALALVLSLVCSAAGAQLSPRAAGSVLAPPPPPVGRQRQPGRGAAVDALLCCCIHPAAAAPKDEGDAEPAWFRCTCEAAGCVCPSTAPPLAPPSSIPQFVLFTHDDALKQETHDALRAVLDGRSSASGCKAAATLFTLARASSECRRCMPCCWECWPAASRRLASPILLPACLPACRLHAAAAAVRRGVRGRQSHADPSKGKQQLENAAEVSGSSALPLCCMPLACDPSGRPAASPCLLLRRRRQPQMNGWGRDEVEAEVVGGRADIARICGIPGEP